MSPEAIETLQERIMREDYDIWQAETAVRRLIHTGRAFLDQGNYGTASDHFKAAEGIARWIDEQLSYIRDYITLETGPCCACCGKRSLIRLRPHEYRCPRSGLEMRFYVRNGGYFPVPLKTAEAIERLK